MTQPTQDMVRPVTQLSEMRFLDIVRFATRRWLVIGLIVLAGLISYYVYIGNATFKYVAELKVIPAESSENALPSGLGGLAEMAGIRLNAGQNLPPFLVYAEQLRSYEVASRISRNPKIMQHLFAESWDPVTGQWHEPRSFGRSIKAAIKVILGIPRYPWHPPAATQVQKFLQVQLDIDENKQNSITTLALQLRF